MVYEKRRRKRWNDMRARNIMSIACRTSILKVLLVVVTRKAEEYTIKEAKDNSDNDESEQR